MIESFYSNFFSVGALIPTLFFVFISLLYISIPNKSRATRHIGIAYVSLAFFNFGYFIAASFYHPLAAYHRWLTVGSILIVETHINMFMFYLFEEKSRFFGKILMGIQYAVVIATTIAFVFVSRASGIIFKAGAHHYDFNADSFSAIVGYVIQLFLLLFIGLLIWKLIRIRGRRRWGVIFIGLIYIAGTVSNSVLNVLSFSGVIEREVFRIVWDISNLIFFFLITVVYFNFTRDKTTFMSKIIAVSFVAILTVIQIINYMTYEIIDRAYGTVHRLATQYAYDSDYTSEDTEYVMRFNVLTGNFARLMIKNDAINGRYFQHRKNEFCNTYIWQKLYLLPPRNFSEELKKVIFETHGCSSGYRNSILEFMETGTPSRNELLELLDRLNSKVASHRDRIERIPEKNFRNEVTRYLRDEANEIRSFIQPVLRHLEVCERDGPALKKEVLLYFKTIHPPDKRQYHEINGMHFISYQAVNAVSGSVFEIGYSYSYYRDFMHNLVSRYLIVIVIMLTVLFVGFRFFFFRELVDSMKRLIDGVKQVSDGNYDVTVDVNVEDEIGFLTRHFNEMVSTIKTNTAELTRELAEKLRAEETLRESERKYRNLFNSANDAIFIHDYDTFAIVDVNERVSKMYGHSREEALSLTINDISYGRNPYTIADEEKYLKKARKGEPQQFEWLARRKDQSLFWVEVNMHRTKIMGEKRILVFVRDISQRKKAEEQLQQAQKIETLGTLTGGIAHDFNNILAGIAGSLSLIEYDLESFNEKDREKLGDYISIIRESSVRAADMVKQLLALSRNEDISYAPVDLNLSINHVVKICESSFDKSIDIVTDYHPDPAMVSADPTRIEQALLNLCVNAAHAMTMMKSSDEKIGGTLRIMVEKIKPESHFRVTFPVAEEVPYWKVSVRDTGVGMDMKTIGKIFDPFFTTKVKGAGTGLGLSMVFNIIKNHQGFIDVYSEVGIGSVFNVYLPVMGRGDVQAEITDESKDIKKGSGLILIVEDEKLIRQMTRAMLNECGYNVIVAEDGRKGIRIFEKRHGQIRAVVLDMVLPKLTGKDVFIEMKKIDPGVRVILTSGYSSDERFHELKEMGVVEFIQKPYTLKDLSEVVDKAVKNG